MSNPRADFSPIFQREPLRLPGGARVAVWVIINMEEWDINEPMARTVLPVPQGRSVIPDVPNYAWYDYGMRVGFWRMKQVLDRHGIRATVSLNASVCNTYPHLVEESLKSGWEMMKGRFSCFNSASTVAFQRATCSRRELALSDLVLLMSTRWPGSTVMSKSLPVWSRR